jgi:hypothetical protein
MLCHVLPHTPLQVMYMEVEPWTKQYVIKNKVVIGNVLGETLRTWGTLWEPDGNTWELDGNTLGTDKKTNPCPHKTQKKVTKPTEPLSLAAWNFYFQNTFFNLD